MLPNLLFTFFLDRPSRNDFPLGFFFLVRIFHIYIFFCKETISYFGVDFFSESHLILFYFYLKSSIGETISYFFFFF